MTIKQPTEDELLDEIIKDAMQAGFDSAMGGSPLASDEENEAIRAKFYKDGVEETKGKIQRLLVGARLDEVNHTPDNFFQIRDGRQISMKERRAQLSQHTRSSDE